MRTLKNVTGYSKRARDHPGTVDCTSKIKRGNTQTLVRLRTPVVMHFHTGYRAYAIFIAIKSFSWLYASLNHNEMCCIQCMKCLTYGSPQPPYYEASTNNERKGRIIIIRPGWCKLGTFICDENPDCYTNMHSRKSTPEGRHPRRRRGLWDSAKTTQLSLSQLLPTLDDIVGLDPRVYSQIPSGIKYRRNPGPFILNR